MSKIDVSNMDLYYGDFHALKNINLSIDANEVTAFIGPSGCGKSTLLKSINRMNDLVPGCRITGEMLLDGENIYGGKMDVNGLRKRVGMVFQKPNPFPMSIYDNIAYGPRTHGVRSKAKLDDIVEQSLRQAGNLGLWKAVPKFDAARGMKFLTYAAPAIRNAMMDMVRDAFAAFEQRMVTEDKDGICYQRVSLDDVLPGEEQLRRIEAIADPYAMQPQSIMEEQESRRELYDGLKRLTQREQTYLLYRYGFTDGEEHPLIGTAIYFHLTKGRAKKTEEQAMDNLWLELPWWFI